MTSIPIMSCPLMLLFLVQLLLAHFSPMLCMLPQPNKHND